MSQPEYGRWEMCVLEAVALASFGRVVTAVGRALAPDARRAAAVSRLLRAALERRAGRCGQVFPPAEVPAGEPETLLGLLEEYVRAGRLRIEDFTGLTDDNELETPVEDADGLPCTLGQAFLSAALDDAELAGRIAAARGPGVERASPAAWEPPAREGTMPRHVRLCR